MADEHTSLAKAHCTVKMHESVGYARKMMGGRTLGLLDGITRQLDPGMDTMETVAHDA